MHTEMLELLTFLTRIFSGHAEVWANAVGFTEYCTRLFATAFGGNSRVQKRQSCQECRLAASGVMMSPVTKK